MSYSHLNLNLLGDLSEDTTVSGAVINPVRGCGETARISAQTQLICSFPDTGCEQLVENSLARENSPRNQSWIRKGDQKGDAVDF